MIIICQEDFVLKSNPGLKIQFILRIRMLIPKFIFHLQDWLYFVLWILGECATYQNKVTL